MFFLFSISQSHNLIVPDRAQVWPTVRSAIIEVKTISENHPPSSSSNKNRQNNHNITASPSPLPLPSPLISLYNINNNSSKQQQEQQRQQQQLPKQDFASF
jgi:hypothetical protein